jgi:hypothetical protein
MTAQEARPPPAEPSTVLTPWVSSSRPLSARWLTGAASCARAAPNAAALSNSERLSVFCNMDRMDPPLF